MNGSSADSGLARREPRQEEPGRDGRDRDDDLADTLARRCREEDDDSTSDGTGSDFHQHFRAGDEAGDGHHPPRRRCRRVGSVALPQHDQHHDDRDRYDLGHHVLGGTYGQGERREHDHGPPSAQPQTCEMDYQRGEQQGQCDQLVDDGGGEQGATDERRSSEVAQRAVRPRDIDTELHPPKRGLGETDAKRRVGAGHGARGRHVDREQSKQRAEHEGVRGQSAHARVGHHPPPSSLGQPSPRPWTIQREAPGRRGAPATRDYESDPLCTVVAVGVDVSIIVPCYNGERFVQQTVASRAGARR